MVETNKDLEHEAGCARGTAYGKIDDALDAVNHALALSRGAGHEHAATRMEQMARCLKSTKAGGCHVADFLYDERG